MVVAAASGYRVLGASPYTKCWCRFFYPVRRLLPLPLFELWRVDVIYERPPDLFILETHTSKLPVHHTAWSESRDACRESQL